MISLRARLFALLMAATGAVWLSAVVWTNTSTRAEVEKVLDARLREAAQMVASLIAEQRVDPAAAAGAAMVQRGPGGIGAGGPGAPGTGEAGDGLGPLTVAEDGYAHQLSCQVWSLQGALVGRSAHAPSAQLSGSETTGFSEDRVGDETWRVYTIVDPANGVRVMVGDNLSVRDRLVGDVMTGLLVPAALVLPLLAGLIWLSVGRGLVPLSRLARGLAARPAGDLSPLPLDPAPREIRPVAAAINGLFDRVSAAREHERAFIAFAAHELKTPLAGLRTQAQVAGMAPDEATRRRALDRLETGVARTDRMVRQLLDLAAVEAEADAESSGGAAAPVPLARLAAELAEDLEPLARARGVAIETGLPADAPAIGQGAFLLQAALRNLLENALLASPEGGTVRLEAVREEPVREEPGREEEAGSPAWRLEVLDRGPGISPGDRARVTDRFYRGAGAAGAGSGLGLAIVAAAAERLGGRLSLAPRPGGGEAARLTLPAAALA